MGQCLKTSEGAFSLKMTDSNAIFGSTPLIFMLNQFSQRRKMRLKRTHRIYSGTEPFELYFRNYSYSKEDQLQNLQMVHLKTTAIYFFFSSNRLMPGSISAPAQGASFYAERTDLEPKMALGFRLKVPSLIFRRWPIKSHYSRPSLIRTSLIRTLANPNASFSKLIFKYHRMFTRIHLNRLNKLFLSFLSYV